VPVTETAGPEETEAAGAELAARLRPGDIVVVAGDLGSGKTTLVRGAARGLGVTDPVTSPTFTIGQRYAARDGLVVAHLDLYRLRSLDDEDPELLDPYLGPDRIAFVEWPEVAEGELEHVTHRVRLEHLGGDRRRVTVEG
jgi:tRNA threonylcarbamoyladenosine biosynthesis protein TsaE